MVKRLRPNETGLGRCFSPSVAAKYGVILPIRSQRTGQEGRSGNPIGDSRATPLSAGPSRGGRMTPETKIGTILANTPKGVLVAALDNKTYLVDDLQLVGHCSLPGLPVASRDAGVRVFARPTFDLPTELIDAQLLADALHQARLEHPCTLLAYLAEQYAEQAPQRAYALECARVLVGFGDGRYRLAPNWRTAYLRERQLAALSTLPAAPAGNKHVGVLRQLGVRNAAGERAVLLDTAAGHVVLATEDSHIAEGQVAEAVPGDRGWRLLRVFNEAAIREQVAAAIEVFARESRSRWLVLPIREQDLLLQAA